MATTTTDTRPLKGWWTLIAAVGIAGLGAAQTWVQTSSGGVIPAGFVGPVLMGIGFLVAWLRSITDTPAGSAGVK